MTECILRNCNRMKDPRDWPSLLRDMPEGRVERILRFREEEDRRLERHSLRGHFPANCV